METNSAEIASGSEDAKVDSEATTAPTGESATPADESGAAKDPVSPEKKRDDGQERFDKLTRDLYELRGELDRGRYEREQRDREVAELRAQLETAKRSQVAPDTPPTLESVGYDEAKFHAATLEYLTKQIRGTVLDEVRGELGKGEQQRAQLEAQKTWAQRAKEFAKAQPDYVDKVERATNLPISRELQAEILQMENGPQIAYYLVENRDKADLIRQLPLQSQLRELGRIEGILEARKLKSSVSQAPPPPAKVAGDSPGVPFDPASPDSDRLSTEEWLKRRNTQLRKARR